MSYLNKSSKLILLVFITVLLPLHATFCLAEEPYRLESIVVEGEAPPEEEEKQEATAFVTVIKNDDFAERAYTVSEVLADSVGINVRKTGGPGAFSTLSIRGSGANQVAVFLDGVPLFGGRAGAVNLADLPLDNVDRIEVYRGVSPARLGEPAIAGAINIVTKKAEAEPVNEVAASYGSADTYEIGLFRSAAGENIDYLLYGNLFSTRGDFRYLDDNGTPYNPNDDERKNRENNDSESANLMVKIGYLPPWGGKFDISNDFYYKDQGLPGTASSSALHTRLSIMRNIAQVQYFKESVIWDRLNLTSRLYNLYEDSRYEDPHGEMGLASQDDANVSRVLGASLLGNIFWPDFQVLNLKLAYENEWFRSYNGIVSENESSLKYFERWNATIAADDEIHLADDKIVISPSVIYKYYANDFSGATPFTGTAVNPEREKHNSVTSRKIGVAYHVLPPVALKANVGRYYRLPEFWELFGDRGYIVGNSDLDPEQSDNWDAGMEFKYPSCLVFSDIYFDYAFFYMDTQNLITLVQNSQRTVRPMNISRARVKGHEFAWSAKIKKHLEVSGNYTLQKSEDLGEVVYWHGKQLPGRPESSLYVKSTLVYPYFKLFYEYSTMSKNYLDRYNSKYQSAKVNSDAGLTIYPKKDNKLSITVEAKNITDEQTEDLEGYPLPGRSYFVTVRAIF
jgi:outer membrane cobalamin receptor